MYIAVNNYFILGENRGENGGKSDFLPPSFSLKSLFIIKYIYLLFHIYKSLGENGTILGENGLFRNSLIYNKLLNIRVKPGENQISKISS